MLEAQVKATGLTGDITREARRLVETSQAWMNALAQEQQQAERDAQIQVLHTIRQYLLKGHDGHHVRRYIASRDVVVTGPTDENGVPTPCLDPVCLVWREREPS